MLNDETALPTSHDEIPFIPEYEPESSEPELPEAEQSHTSPVDVTGSSKVESASDPCKTCAGTSCYPIHCSGV